MKTGENGHFEFLGQKVKILAFSHKKLFKNVILIIGNYTNDIRSKKATFPENYGRYGSSCDSFDQKCDWCDWCDLWLAFNFGPWFFFVIGVIDVICVIDVIDMIDVINVIDVIDVIGVINVISVIDVIGVIDVILLSQNMIWRTQFYCFFIFSVVTVFFCFATSENFHLSKLWNRMKAKNCIMSIQI